MDALRGDLRKQLQVWEQQRALDLMESEVVQVYRLLSGGDASVWREMDGRRRLGSVLWYRVAQHETLGQALRSFQDCKLGPALPRYAEGYEYEGEPPTDLCFALMRRFVDPTLPLSHVLDPLNYSPCALDYHLVFHVHWVISRVLVRSGNGPERVRFEQSPGVHERLAEGYAFQLEALGLWHWAAYVLVQSGAPQCFVDELVMRHAPELDEHKERFLRDTVGLGNIIDEAQVMYNKDQTDALVRSLRRGRSWDELHRLVRRRLGPLGVILGWRTEQLHELLYELRENLEPEKWRLGGRVYLQHLSGGAPVAASDLASLWKEARDADDNLQLLSLTKMARAHHIFSYMVDEDKHHALRLEQAAFLSS